MATLSCNGICSGIAPWSAVPRRRAAVWRAGYSAVFQRRPVRPPGRFPMILAGSAGDPFPGVPPRAFVRFVQ